MPIRILVADDTPAVRRGVKNLLEREGFEVIGEAADGEEAIRLAQALDPDVVILDLSMPLLNGLEAASEIRHVCPRIHMILLTVHIEEHQIVRAFWVGIRGYVVKNEAAEVLARAVEEVFRGDTFLSPRASGVVAQAYVPKTNCPVFGGRPMVPCEICGLCPPEVPEAPGPAPTR